MKEKLTKKQITALLVDADMNIKNEKVKYMREITEVKHLIEDEDEPSKMQLLVMRKAFKTLQENNLHTISPEQLFRLGEYVLNNSNKLTKKKRNLEILKLRYGYYNKKFYTYVDIGRKFDVTDSTIRNSILNTMKKIRENLQIIK